MIEVISGFVVILAIVILFYVRAKMRKKTNEVDLTTDQFKDHRAGVEAVVKAQARRRKGNRSE